MTTENHSILVSIPDCTATHVLGSTSVPLISGTLSLIKYTSPLSSSPSARLRPEDIKTPQPVLTLQIGKLAFPLMKDTLFGTDATSTRVYLFTPELGPTGQGAQGGGHIRLELPPQVEETVDPDSGKSNDGNELRATRQDVFEQALIREGLLKEGWAAIRDEIERGVKSTVGGLRG